MNFLEETLEEMKRHNKTKDDVDFIYFGCENEILTLMSIEENNIDWEKLNFQYDEGYGGNEIHLNSIVSFKDNTWLERHEYDGSEWWEYKKKPTLIDVKKDLERYRELTTWEEV